MAKDRASTPAEAEGLLELLERHVLPLRVVRLTLRTERDCTLRFFHSNALSAWLRGIANDGAEDSAIWYTRLRLDAPESGRVDYRRGDTYAFTLIATAAGVATLRRLLERLWLPDARDGGAEGGMAFGPHWRLSGVVDHFTGSPINVVEELRVYDAKALADEAARWRTGAREPLVWQWLSPARLLRDKERRGKGEQRFCRDAHDLSLRLLLERCHDALAALLRGSVDATPARGEIVLPPSARVSHDVFWVEDDYRPASGAPKPKGGLLGRHRLVAELTPAWTSYLVLGQYLGIGQGTASGLGRYRLEREDGRRSYCRGDAERSWMDRALEPPNLYAAWRHVSTVRGETEPEEPADTGERAEDEGRGDADGALSAVSVTAALGGRLEALERGSYRVPPARAGFLPKADGSARPIAIAPFWDAVLQRAFSQALTPSLDSLMHPSSYGYRRGRSRRSAAEAIQQARRQGYRWVYDADIEDFFGSVDHERLRSRLRALLVEDTVVEALMGWVRAPVAWQGERYPRVRGLPQGSSLSPLLANLMLDDFDNDMRAAGVRAVRFADDFVLLAKSRERAEAAARAARRSLAEHGFALHEEKRATRDLDDGVDFLGYLFVGDLALDLAGSGRRERAARPGAREVSGVHAERWLARISGRRPRVLSERQLLAEEARQGRGDIASETLLALGEQYDPGGSVFVVGPASSLYTENGSLVVVREELRLLARPWRHLRNVFVMGRHNVSTPALRAAMAHGVTIHLTSASGRYEGALAPRADATCQRRWLEQLIASEDEAFAVPIACALVGARVRHQRDVLRARRDSEIAFDTTALLRRVNEAQALGELNGAEGLAASAYFEAFAALVPEPFTFGGRARRPPPDPVNALLSYGYTLLYGLADSLLRGQDLLPAIGLYHRQRGKHSALASDMIEPFRHVVERQTLRLLRRRSLTPEDFRAQPDGSWLMATETRKRFVGMLVERLSQPVRAVGEVDALPLRNHLERQCHSLGQALLARDPERFRVFRMR